MKNFRNKVALFVMVLAVTIAGDAFSQEKKERHVFLLIGQSNMAGRAAIESVDKEPIEGVYLWNIGEKKWESALPPYNLHSPSRKDVKMQRLNCGPSFARAYAENHPDVEVGIVCAARGGTSIWAWDREKPDQFDLYRHAIEATRAALADGKSELKGILWHQGESDSGKKVSSYPKRLKQLIADLRVDLQSEKLPFVFAQVGQWKPAYSEFNEMIVKQSPEIPYSACVMTEGLKPFDEAHFNSKGQRELGKRYAAAIETLISKK